MRLYEHWIALFTMMSHQNNLLFNRKESWSQQTDIIATTQRKLLLKKKRKQPSSAINIAYLTLVQVIFEYQAIWYLSHYHYIIILKMHTKIKRRIYKSRNRHNVGWFFEDVLYFGWPNQPSGTMGFLHWYVFIYVA